MSNDIQAWSARNPMIIGLVGLILLVGGFGTWASLAEITGAIIAPGKIEVDQNRQVVQHPVGGVVAEISVGEGDKITRGQVLIRLDDTRLQSQLTITESQLFEMMARRARLQAERDGLRKIQFDPLIENASQTRSEVAELMAGQSRLMQARADTIAKEIAQLGKRRNQIASQIEGIKAQIVSLGSQLELITSELADQQNLLDKGLAQASRVLALQREKARLTGSVGETQAQKASAEGQITELEIEELKLESQLREEAITNLRDLQFRELELQENRNALLERLSRLEVTSPVDGVVYGMQFFAQRSVIRPAEPILYVVPQDRPLVINSKIEPIHIDKLFLGQDVTLRFTALDQRSTPELNGKVVQISADAFTDEATALAYYEAEIVLGEGELDRLPDGVQLIPGMPVDAFIRTDERTPIAYLTKPFTDYFKKAFRQ